MRGRLSNVRFASTLVVAAHNGKALDPATLNALTAATKIGGDVSVLVAGHNVEALAKEAQQYAGVKKVLYADAESLDHGLAEGTAALLASVVKSHSFSHVIAPANSRSKSALPRAAGLLGVGAVSEATAVVSEDTFVRPIYAGNALATVKTKDPVKIVTIRVTSFARAAATGGSATLEKVQAVDAGRSSKWVREEVSKSERPSLQEASTVVSGGRGLQSAEKFGILNALADKLGAAVGASRGAVDAGYAPNDLQIGQTGKVVAPQLYIAVGISGAIQHLAGMKDSKCIVAINKDPEAPIFQVADHGLVADLFVAVPELTKKLQ